MIRLMFFLIKLHLLTKISNQSEHTVQFRETFAFPQNGIEERRNKLKIQKPIFAFLILLLLTAGFAIVIFVVSSKEIIMRENERTQLKIDGIAKTIDTIENEITEAMIKNEEREESLLELMSLMLNSFMLNGKYYGPELFGDGLVVRIDGDKIIYPRGQEAIPGLEADMIKNDISIFANVMYHGDGQYRLAEIRSVPIAGSYYYLDLVDNYGVLNSILVTIRMRETIMEIEKSYDCKLLIISDRDFFQSQPDDPDIPRQFLIQPTGKENTDLLPEDIGIDEKFLSEKPDSFIYDGIIYRSDYDEIVLMDYLYRVIILNSAEKENAYLINSILLYVSLTMIAGICIIFWLYWVQVYVRDNELLPEQLSAYKPKVIHKNVNAFILVSGIGMFLLAVFFRSLSNLNRQALLNRDALNTVMERLDEHSEEISANQMYDEFWAVYFVNRIASVLKENDELWTREYLTKINDVVGSEYMMLFDTEGKNVLSSNGLIGYSLTETESLLEFADLLKGIPTIVGKPMTDNITEVNSQLIGASIPFEQEGLYAALIMSIDIEDSWVSADERMLREFLANATPVGNLCVVIDKNNNTVVYSSDPDYIGETLPGLVYKDGAPESSDLDTYRINNNSYYGAYDSNEKYVSYYLTESSYVEGKFFLYAFSIAFGFMIIVFLVSRFMLHPYTPENYKAFSRLKESTQIDNSIEMGTLDDFFEKNDDDTPIKLKDRWNGLIPEQKIQLFVQIFLGIILFLAVLSQYIDANESPFSTRSTLNFILFGNWTRGFNLLGLAGTLIVIFSFVIFVFFKDILLKILCTVLDPKGETICRLTFSLLQYTAVLGGIYLIMGFLGFNTSFQLTSVGIISLAISLGSKDIVADILAGIFIIFEGDFQVGDFVDINGYQGIVREIGVRSTKVLGLGDNIKIIGNQNVVNVLNMSKMNTWLTLEFRLPPGIPLLEVEQLLEKELPEIGKRIPEIISGPYYKGVWMVNDFGKRIIHISCECIEQNSRTVQRQLNREVILLLEGNGYKL